MKIQEASLCQVDAASSFEENWIQIPIEFYTTYVLISCLAIGHLVVHVAQVTTHIPPHSPTIDRAFLRSRWFLDDEYSCHTKRPLQVLARSDMNSFEVSVKPFQTFGMEAGISSNKMLFLVHIFT